MKNKTRSLGSAVLLGVLAWVIKWGELAEAFRQIDWRPWALAVGVLVAAQVVSSWRWQLLAKVLHFGGLLRRFVAYYFIGMLFNLVLPTSVGGDVVRAWYLAAQEGSPPPRGRRLEAFLSVFAERFQCRTVDEDGVFDRCGYVLANPVHAGLCDGIEDWPWSYSRLGPNVY